MTLPSVREMIRQCEGVIKSHPNSPKVVYKIDKKYFKSKVVDTDSGQTFALLKLGMAGRLVNETTCCYTVEFDANDFLVSISNVEDKTKPLTEL